MHFNKMMGSLINLDEKILLLINGNHNGFLDFVMFWMSNKFVWIPLYLLFLFLFVKKYKKASIVIILGLIIVASLSDLVSVHAFKNIFMRLRPCHQPHLSDLIHLVNDKCGGQFGFYSSHASNHFAVAVFVSKFLGKYYRGLSLGLLLWATVISYSRVYLGAHFPSDVIVGGIAGAAIAFMGVWLLAQLSPKLKNV